MIAAGRRTATRRAAGLGLPLLLVLGLAACEWTPPSSRPAKKPAAPAAALTKADRLPRRAELPCFPCHSHVKFDKGPPFPHAGVGHRDAGHCHRCHLGSAHEGRQIDTTACLSCHAEDSEEHH